MKKGNRYIFFILAIGTTDSQAQFCPGPGTIVNNCQSEPPGIGSKPAPVRPKVRVFEIMFEYKSYIQIGTQKIETTNKDGVVVVSCDSGPCVS